MNRVYSRHKIVENTVQKARASCKQFGADNHPYGNWIEGFATDVSKWRMAAARAKAEFCSEWRCSVYLSIECIRLRSICLMMSKVHQKLNMPELQCLWHRLQIVE